MIARALFLKGLAVATGGLDIWSTPVPAAPPPAADREGTIRVLLPDRRIAVLDLEAYLRGVVPLEMPPSWPLAALQAQAIVARTYAVRKRTLASGYDVVAGDVNQQYGGAAAEHPTSNAAVEATRGLTLSYLGGPTSVFYSSCCGGHTADAAGLWGRADLPYLHGVADPYCTASPDYRWERTLALQRARAALANRGCSAFTEVVLGPPDDSGRPLAATFLSADGGEGATVAVVDVRARWGPATVLSSWLRSVAVDPTQAAPLVAIEGSGRGHGVGLCQWGARGMATAGADAPAILGHYFPGTAVTGA